MKEMLLLTECELKNLYGWNVFRHTKDPKARRKYLALAAVCGLLIVMVTFYVGALSWGLISLGMGGIVPAYLIMISSILILVFGFFKAGNTLFSRKGYEILSSLPISQEAVVVSRFLQMYVTDLALAFLVMVPGLAVYAVMEKPGIRFYVGGLLGICLVPGLPLAVSSLIGTVITAVSARMKRKSLTQTVLSLAVVLAVLLSSFGFSASAESMTPEMLAALADTVGDLIVGIYPPAAWLGSFLVSGKPAGFLLFGGVSLGAVGVMTALAARNFHRICRGLFATSARHDYRMETLKREGMLKALYIRECKRYFASSIYVTNTVIGPIMAVILSAAVAVTGVETLEGALPLPVDAAGLIPFAVAGVMTMMTTTSVSVSMEGKEFWIVKSLPVSVKTLWDSKILLNLSLIGPCWLISEVLLIASLRPSLGNLVWLVLIPAVISLFAVVLGITVNLRFCNFDWDKEETVVKQSASAALGGFAGILTSLVCGAAVLVAPAQWTHLVKGVICLAVLGVTALLYRRNAKAQLQKL